LFVQEYTSQQPANTRPHWTLEYCCRELRPRGTQPQCAQLPLGTALPQELERAGVRRAAGSSPYTT